MSDDIRSLTPQRIVEELDKYIVGQHDAKRAVAIAIRNRWRRQQIHESMRDDITPKNILMIGPTGVGKTEIARRMATLVKAPFIKVEASKYTEVGYHGRDVESMIRDLVEVSFQLVHKEHITAVQEKAVLAAKEKTLDLLLPPPTAHFRRAGAPEAEESEEEKRFKRTREKFRGMLDAGGLEDREVEVSVEESPAANMQVLGMGGMESMGIDLQSMFEKAFPAKRVTRKMKVPEALRVLAQQEAEKLIDRDKAKAEALERAQNSGIIFIDEIDKIAGGGKAHGPDVSREGVQRDLLPIVEGSTVSTRYGVVSTEHILFVAAGAFHVAQPADLIPELQGRFPIRVELSSLTKDDFLRILTEPKNAILKQYQALLGTEGVAVEFRPDAVERLATIASEVNRRMQNIGARRLHTVVEKLLEKTSFDAPQWSGRSIVVDAAFVDRELAKIAEDEDLSRYVL